MRSRVVCLLMFVCCIVVGECKGEGYDPPPQCAAVDCPRYSVIHSEKEFEIRNYSEAIWMSSPTFVDSSLMGGFGVGGFNMTFYYFWRRNDQGVAVTEAESPVAMMDVLGNSSYTFFFSLDQKYQNGSSIIPKPLIPEITQVKLPKYKYAAVRRSLGEISDVLVAGQLDDLKRNLQGTAYQRAVDRNQYTFVSYNAYEFTTGYEVLIWFD